ncbi:MAG: hypothetical protein NVS3B1_22080 [Marmoricola sp.]
MAVAEIEDLPLDDTPLDFVEIEGLVEEFVEDGPWVFDEDDWVLYALMTDPVYMPELLWKDPQNREYGGCYRVRDYQYRLNRCKGNYAIFACARSVGKTESEKVHAQIHGFDGDSEGENMLITAPELIHLLPLTDAIEENIRDSRILSECLDTRGGQTGFTHRPFGVNWIDGTKLVGRIPKVTGTGVKGQHQRKLIVEEGQDYPEKGWIEVNETVNYDSTDRDGEESFRFWVYGVHAGNKASGFDEKARSKVWEKIQVTALMRPDWGRARKENAMAAYGGSSSPDYRRNILGEPGAGASKYFVTARVMACVDQQVERPPDQKGSHYNTVEYVAQTFRAEEMDSLGMNIADLLDLPEPGDYDRVWLGQDVGLTDSPTVITIWGDKLVAKKPRRVLIRKFTLERFRPKDIRKTLYTIAWHFGPTLVGAGIDITGLGFPMFQDMEDDELCPPHLLNVTVGYMFNAKIPVGVDKNMVTENHGVLRDQYGNMVKEIEDTATGEKRYIVMMPFIAASTRYVREGFDSGFYLLPFDTDVINDILGETKQRVEKIGQREGSVKKGDRFHILDSIRAMAMRSKTEEIEEQIREPEQQPVLDYAM